MKPQYTVFVLESDDENPRFSAVTVRFDRCSRVVHINHAGAQESEGIRIEPEHIENLIQILTNGRAIIFDKAKELSPTLAEQFEYPQIHRDGSSAFDTVLRVEGGSGSSTLSEGFFVSPEHSGEINPNKGYLIRNEEKDRFFSLSDKENNRRVCTGPQSEAYICRSEYEAHRWAQGMKHSYTVIPVDILWAVRYRYPYSNSTFRYYNGVEDGTPLLKDASRFTMEQAKETKRRLTQLNCCFDISLEHVAS